ncbi:MAG: hypothetical protein HYZ29_30085 [Myxococcales bacterium]|nr:hypothetical protein [Myxococcales bacterium]
MRVTPRAPHDLSAKMVRYRAAVLNLQRAARAAFDLAAHVVATDGALDPRVIVAIVEHRLRDFRLLADAVARRFGLP